MCQSAAGGTIQWVWGVCPSVQPQSGEGCSQSSCTGSSGQDLGSLRIQVSNYNYVCLCIMVTRVFFWNSRKCMSSVPSVCVCIIYFCSHVSQLYCQLQGHVMSCDPPPTELEGRENCVISVSMTARHLLQMVGLHS